MHRIWGTIYLTLFCFCGSLFPVTVNMPNSCLLVLQARKIMVFCLDYFSSLNHPMKFYLFLKLVRMGNSFHANFLPRSLDTPPESAWFGFSLFSLQVIFNFLSALFPSSLLSVGSLPSQEYGVTGPHWK